MKSIFMKVKSKVYSLLYYYLRLCYIAVVEEKSLLNICICNLVLNEIRLLLGIRKV